MSARGRMALRQSDKATKRINTLLWVCIAVLAVAIAGVCGVWFAGRAAFTPHLSTQQAFTPSPPPPTVAATPAASTPPATPAATLAAALLPSVSAIPGASPESTTVWPATQPPASVRQLIVVIATGSAAKVSLYELTDGKWSLILKTDGCVGNAGVTDAGDKREGDKKTPAGLYRLGFVFGTEKPKTQMDFRLITKDSYWVDDADSPDYNTWQEEKGGWKSAERLADSPKTYHYAVTVDYNTDRVPGKGSAIFLHCMTKSTTTGCIAVPEGKLLEILKRLDPKMLPSILIEDSAEAANEYGLAQVE